MWVRKPAKAPAALSPAKTAGARKVTVSLYQQTERPEALFGHIFGDSTGFLATFTGVQARFSHPDARPNELADTRQHSWSYPAEAKEAARYLLEQSAAQRDAYVAVHLFRKAGSRLAANAVPNVRALWLDEDDGHYPEEGPEPTAIVHSSATRRHLYWRLTHAVTVEWAVTMNRRVATFAGGDSGKAGLASVLRVPGTRNFKRSPQVDPVTLAITEADRWGPEVLEQAIPEISEPPRGAQASYDGPEVALQPYLERVEIIREMADGLGRKYAIVCPWVREHSGGDRSGTRLGRRSGGGLWFHCDHEHCQGRSWQEFKRAVFWNRRFTAAPAAYTGPPLTVEVHYE